MNVHGEKIWNEELTKIILFAVEKEAKHLINKKYTAQLIEQEQEIPRFRPVDVNDQTFMGRVLRQIMDSVSQGFYLDSMCTWYDNQGN